MSDLMYHKPEKIHEEFHEALFTVVQEHSEQLAGQVILAIMANVMGRLAALEHGDPRGILELIVKNIEQGNRDALALLEVPAGVTRQ